MNESLIEKLGQYKRVAAYLKDDANQSVIDKLMDCVTQRNYLLPLIGQFSAGKSKLLNRIIGKDVLPTKREETTAFLTYISYAPEESATLYYVDGSTEEIEVDQIKDLDYKKTSDGKPIACLKYRTPLELLKTGLTLVDTPGVNTLISEHIKMTEELLSNSQYIVYVCSSALTESDKMMLKQANEMGIELIFVRTHIDEIKRDEEDIFESLEKEAAVINNVLERPILYFSMCNDASRRKLVEGLDGYDEFNRFLRDVITSSIEDIYAVAIQQRLNVLKTAFEQRLKGHLSLIDQHHEKDAGEIANTLKGLEKQREIIERRMKSQGEAIQEKANRCKSTIGYKLTDKANGLRGELDLLIHNLAETECSKEKVERVFTEQVATSITELNKVADQEISQWKEERVSEVQNELKEFSIELKPLQIDFNPDFNLEVVDSYEEQSSANLDDIAEKYHEVKQLNEQSEKELAELGIEKAKIQEMINQYDQLIAQGNDEIKTAIQNYEPQLIQKGGKYSKWFKRVGEAADIAMLLMPAIGFEKAAVKLAAKAGTLAKNAGTLSKVGAKLLQQGSKAANYMGKLDKMMDASKIIKYTKDTLEKLPTPVQPKKNKAGFFDYLSLSYWFEKAGNLIDPVTYVEDESFKAEYNKVVAHMQTELDNKVAYQVSLQQKLRNIKDKEEVKKLEKQTRHQLEEQLEQDKLRIKERFEREHAAKLRQSLLNEARTQYKSKVAEYKSVLDGRVSETIDLVASNIVSAMDDFVRAQLDDVKKQLDRLLSQRDTFEVNWADEKKQISELIQGLQVANE